MFCHFGPFLALDPPNNPKNQNFEKMKNNVWRYYFTHVYRKWKSCDLYFLRYGVQQTEFFLILDHFLHFYPRNNLEKFFLKKTKKTLGDIIIIHKCAINDTHMMCVSWDVKRDTIFCHFEPFFALLQHE